MLDFMGIFQCIYLPIIAETLALQEALTGLLLHVSKNVTIEVNYLVVVNAVNFSIPEFSVASSIIFVYKTLISHGSNLCIR